jgi:AcrR family transcriptional regulator
VPKRKDKPLDRKEAFLRASLECVKKVGIFKTNSYSISKQLGVTQPSFYYYFPSQEDFYRELVAYMVRINRDLVTSLNSIKHEKCAWDRLENYLTGNLKWAEKYPAQMDVLTFGFLSCAQDKAVNKLVFEALKKGEERVYEIIADGFTGGEFRPALSAHQAAHLLHKALLGASIQINDETADATPRDTIEANLLALARTLLNPH